MLIGREREQKVLNKILHSKEAEFLVVYGRRRVGKTFLIQDYFQNKPCVLLHATGTQNGNLKKQLANFSKIFADTFFNGLPLQSFLSWDDAFMQLSQQIRARKEKVVVFLDELPWMAARKSGLLEALDYHWNRYWSVLPNLVLIVCGSSASWLIKKIIYNKGGLHNRITGSIQLAPFNLAEVRAYLKSRKVKLTDNHILCLYMALGGIPYYLRYVEPGLTAQQNIQQILFADNAPLQDEFNKLFHSLFANAEAYIELIKLIAKKPVGISRADLEQKAKHTGSGGRLTHRIKDLTAAGFIQEYTAWQRKQGEYYKLIDEFSLFYLQWVKVSKTKQFPREYWLAQSDTPAYHAWSGYAFERVCSKHIDQVMHALHIKSAATIHAWRHLPKNKLVQGAQIDLLVDRTDDAITLCEMKYTTKPYLIDKQYAKQLRDKRSIFQQVTNTDKQLFWALVTASGLKKNRYSDELISHVVTLSDLFVMVN